MKKHIPIIIFITILVAMIFIAAMVVINNYEKNRPINPDNNLENISENDMIKIKEKYETERRKNEFLSLCNEIELAVTNRFLDGTVTNDEELKKAIDEINDILKTNNWERIELEYPTYWMGVWQLDSQGKVKFSFKYEEIMPSWVKDKEVSKYIK